MQPRSMIEVSSLFRAVLKITPHAARLSGTTSTRPVPFHFHFRSTLLFFFNRTRQLGRKALYIIHGNREKCEDE